MDHSRKFPAFSTSRKKQHHRCPFPIGWLINRGVWRNPFKQQVSMMIDGIPAPGPSIFTERTWLKNIEHVFNDQTWCNMEATLLWAFSVIFNRVGISEYLWSKLGIRELWSLAQKMFESTKSDFKRVGTTRSLFYWNLCLLSVFMCAWGGPVDCNYNTNVRVYNQETVKITWLVVWNIWIVFHCFSIYWE